MKNYVNFMNRQILSETALEGLLALGLEEFQNRQETSETVRSRQDPSNSAPTASKIRQDSSEREQAAKKEGQGEQKGERNAQREVERNAEWKGEREMPQWVKYTAMAASFFLILGFFAMAVLIGPRNQGLPVATQTSKPVTLYFNDLALVMDSLTNEATWGVDSGTIDAAAIEEMVKVTEESLADIGWEGYEFSGGYYYSGVKYGGEGGEAEQTLVADGTDGAGNHFELRVRPNGSFYAEEWKDLRASEVWGQKVVAVAGLEAATGKYDACATFTVSDGQRDYGIFYAAMNADEATSREMVTKLVEHLTAYGISVEEYMGETRYEVRLRYAELVDPEAVCSTIGEEGDVNINLSAAQVAEIFPASADEPDYQWWGVAWLNKDEELRELTIWGVRHDGTGQVSLEAGYEEEIFYLRQSDGSYPGVDNTSYAQGVDVLRCYYRTYPEFYWWWDGSTQKNGVECTCEYQTANSRLAAKLTTYVKDGTLEAGEAFNSQWVNKALKGGIWMHTKMADGREIWELPESVTEAEPQEGTYIMEPAGGVEPEDLDRVPVLTLKDGVGTFRSEALSFHTCVCDQIYSERENGRPYKRFVCGDCGSAYTFEVVDEHTLRYAAEKSGVYDHHGDWTFLLTDGVIFRQYVYGDTEDIEAQIKAAEDALADDIAAAKEGFTAWNQADTSVGHHHQEEHHTETHH